MAMTLITTNTSSNAASSSFTSSIDSTYKLYIFKFININPATDDVNLTFQVNATDGADYNDSNITSTSFRAKQLEDGSGDELGYITGSDIASAATFQDVLVYLGNETDEGAAGEMYLFNPSNTTYVKHFFAVSQAASSGPMTYSAYVAGYINDTTAIDDIQFKMSSGNFDGTIKMYGVG